MTTLTAFLEAFWAILVESGVYLVAGFFVAGLIHAFIPARLLTRHLGGRGFLPVLKASAIGIPLPLCSCSVIPTAAALRRAGASKGASASFATTTPQIDVPAIALTWALTGPLLAIARPIVSLIAGVLAGVGIDAAERQPAQPPVDPAPPKPSSKPCCSSASAPRTISLSVSSQSCCEPQADAAAPPLPCCADKAKAASRFDAAIAYAFITLPRDLARWLLLGLALSAAIVVLVPQDWVTKTLSSGLGHIAGLALMLVIGLPWYVCATASTPLAAVFIAKGVSPGAALVFLLAGPATNAATMAWVAGDLGRRSLAIYLAAISLTALAAGFALDAMLRAGTIPQSWVAVADSVTMGAHEGIAAQVFGGVAGLILLFGLLKLPRRA